jgi:RNA polymerase primary sigma factor
MQTIIPLDETLLIETHSDPAQDLEENARAPRTRSPQRSRTRHTDTETLVPRTPELPASRPPGLDNSMEAEPEEPTADELSKEDSASTQDGGDDAPPSPPDEPSTPASRSSPDGSTAIRIYLREIGQVKLLTPQEEIVLAARIQKGDKKAREQMIKANLRLVVRIARSYEGIGLPLLDLISEGNIGLMKAVERFDPAKGAKLSTYAAWWIKQSMKRALATQAKTVRLPVHMIDKISKMRRSSLRLQEELGRQPTSEELAEDLGTTVRRIGEMQMAAIPPTSLDAPIEGDDSTCFAEFVEDEKADSPYETLKVKTLNTMLRDMVKVLSQREVAILKARYGLEGNPCQTLDEIGEDLGVTRERVRQLQNNALGKLRKMLHRMEASEA